MPLVEIQFPWYISLSGPKVYQENYQCFYISLFRKCHCFCALKTGDYSVIQTGSNERKTEELMNLRYDEEYHTMLNLSYFFVLVKVL